MIDIEYFMSNIHKSTKMSILVVDSSYTNNVVLKLFQTIIFNAYYHSVLFHHAYNNDIHTLNHYLIYNLTSD